MLFDRDGTLVVDVPYNGDPGRVRPVPGAAAAVVLTSFHQSPLPVALVLRLAGVPYVAGASVDHAGALLDVRLRCAASSRIRRRPGGRAARPAPTRGRATDWTGSWPTGSRFSTTRCAGTAPPCGPPGPP